MIDPETRAAIAHTVPEKPKPRSGVSLQTAPKECWDVTRTLRDRNNFNRPVFSAIDDQVGANRPEQHRQLGEVLPIVAHARRARKGLERTKQLSEPAVGGVDVIGGEVFPDFVEVEVGINAENITRHGVRFRRFCDFCRSLARDSTGSMFSPRSSEASRRPSS